MPVRSLQVLVVVAVLYVAAQMLADITALRILSIAGLSISGGTLIYPITFTLRDLAHKVSTAGIARILIFASAAINLFMALLFWLVAELPPDPAVGAQAEFGLVLAPVFRITIASIVAEVVSELIDTEIYEVWVRRFAQRWQWGRVLASNAVSVPVDSALFTLLAFWGRAAHRGDAELVSVEHPGQIRRDLRLDPGHLFGARAAEGVAQFNPL